MQYDDLARAVTAAIAFGSMLAGHYFADQWVQTSAQACKKGLDGAERRTVAMWHCAKHVITHTATIAVFFLLAAWWLHLPVRPGWLAAGLAVNAVTHFVADLRTPLLWLARLTGIIGYIEHAQVMRPSGVEKTGPGTALFHLDLAYHLAILLPVALLIAGPA